MNYPQVGLRPGEERDLRTGKLWIYENELEWAEDTCRNGDIVACLDIERRPELVQGNILKDRFKDVWENKFAFYRQGLDTQCAFCADCDVKEFCAGGAHHSFDYDRNEQRICFKDQAFFV